MPYSYDFHNRANKSSNTFIPFPENFLFQAQTSPSPKHSFNHPVRQYLQSVEHFIFTQTKRKKMGCAGSLLVKRNGTVRSVRKPKPWKFPQPITISQLMQMRDEFWDTAPHHGGKKEIWDALHAAAEADITLAQAIVNSAGVLVHKPDLTVCYDERGAKYELPKYVLSEPYNLIREKQN